MPITPELRAELEELAPGEPGTATSRAWVGTENYEMRVAADGSWIDVRDPRDHAGATRMSVLAIDAGTTGVTAVVVERRRHDLGQGLPGVRAALPQAGLGRARARGDLAGDARGHPRGADGRTTRRELQAIGITNQRETVMLWDRETLGSPRRAIVWQDRRTADLCTRLRDDGHEDRVARADRAAARPLLLRHQADVAGRERAAHLGAGRVRPLRHRHRRLLPDRADDPRHLPRHRRLQRVPHAALRPRRPATGPTSCARCSAYPATRCPSWCPTGARSRPPTRSRSSTCRCRSPGLAGDQQSALFGQTCFDEGDSKCTYGTGSFILTNTGSHDRALRRRPALDRRVALAGRRDHLRARGLDLRDRRGRAVAARRAPDRRRRPPRPRRSRATVHDSEGVVFVPALTGLGAPHWDPHARGMIIGLTRGTTRAHIVRATLEAIAFEVRDVLDTMPGARPRCGSTAARPPTTCSARSRPTRSAYRSSGRSSSRPPPSVRRSSPASAPGSGTSTDDLRDTWTLDRRFEPAADRADRRRRPRPLVRRRRARRAGPVDLGSP